MIITKQQWEQAQAGELVITRYDDSLDQERVSSIILEFFNKTTKSFKGKKILEVGGGPFPAVGFCNGTKATVVDPLSDQFNTKYRGDNVNWVSEQFEDYSGATVDEVWVFNVLQHVIDPQALLEKAATVGKVVRVFEPINTPTNRENPQSLDTPIFEAALPGVKVNKYIGGSRQGFHGADCVYFEYTAPKVVLSLDTPEPVVSEKVETMTFPVSSPDIKIKDPTPTRARNGKGHYVADDPSTPENEAWVGGVAPSLPKKTKRRRKSTKKSST